MSLSQFVYSLAGLEDQIPESQLDSANGTPEKLASQDDKLPLPTSTVISSNPVASASEGNFRDVNKARDPLEEPVSPTRGWFDFGVSATPALEPPPTVPDVSPETPTSFLGYFFGGNSENIADEVSSPKPVDGKIALEAHTVNETEVVADIPADDPGFGSFLWTLVAGEEEEQGQPPIVEPEEVHLKAQPSQEEKPRNDVPQPSYLAKKPDPASAVGFTDSDAEEIVQRIEQGGRSGAEPPSGLISRKSIMSDMEIKMKLNEAKVSLQKLKEIQKETNTMLGITTPSVIRSNDKGSGNSHTDAPEVKLSGSDPISKRLSVKKFVPRQTRTHVSYKAKLPFQSLNAPVSDRLKAYPPSIGGPLHSRQPMPFNISGNFPRDVVVVSSVEARSLRQN